jgi:hypothetical protein
MDVEIRTWIHGHRDMDMETWAWAWRQRHGDMEFNKSNGKWNPRRFAFIFLFVCSLCNGGFIIYPFVDEVTNGSYLFANGRKEFAHL